MNIFQVVRSKFSLVAAGPAVGLLPLTVFALPQVPEEPGWAGQVTIGAAYTDVDSNTVVGNRLLDLGERTITDINQDARSTDDTISALSGEVRWTLARRNQLFVGTSVEDRVTLDGVTQLGWRKGTDSAGTFQVSLLSTQALTQRVWQDPYRTETDGRRSTTDRDGNGIRFQWDRIFNTMFEVQLSSRDIDVDKETSGETECLNNSCVRSLRRDGDMVDLAVGYLFNPGGGKHFLRPEVSFTSMDADGSAKEYDSGRVKLTYSYLGDEFKFIGNVAAGGQDFKNANPLYGEDQDSDLFVIGASVLYKLPFESGRWQAVADTYYGDIDSDIDFHDTTVLQVTVGVQYNFGALQDARASKQ